MAVIADINAHARVLRLKHWISKVARSEVELLPKSGMAMRNVMLAILSEITTVRVDDRSRVEVHTRHVLFINGSDDYHLVFRRNLPHKLRGWPIWHAFCQFVPSCILLGAKIGSIKEFLQAKDLRLLACCLFDQLQVLVDHRFPDLIERTIRAERVAGLNQGATDDARHKPSNSTVGNEL